MRSPQDTTKWACSINTSGSTPVASLTVATNGGAAVPFKIKGICYSPCPIGASNKMDPCMGDWFWDTYQVNNGTTQITNWFSTWGKDIEMIANLGVNVIRLYCMVDQQLPSGNPAHTFSHKDFLEECYRNGLYVIIGFPSPGTMFYNETSQPVASWWEANLTQTVREVGGHPAVLGFTIANEVDNGAVNTYGPSTLAQIWWNEVNRLAGLAKAAAPGKLVGIANHDDAGICAHCQSYMTTCNNIDFWGVNTYQPQSFDAVFGGGGVTTGYALLTGAALKPVILTEYGFPATSRPDAATPSGIYSDDTTVKNTANVLNTMLPKVYQQQLCIGMCYFEYCDEWWDQDGFSIPAGQICPGCSGHPNCPQGGTSPTIVSGPPNDHTWWGGQVSCDFPNYYWDVDGFGLYAVGVGTGRDPAHPWGNNEPASPPDTRTARAAMIEALMAAYRSVTV